MAQDAISYDKKELTAIKRAFKAMDEQALEEAKKKSNALADFLRGKIITASYGREKAPEVARRIVEGSKVSKSSKLGELSIGYASQRFSGGATSTTLGRHGIRIKEIQPIPDLESARLVHISHASR